MTYHKESDYPESMQLMPNMKLIYKIAHKVIGRYRVAKGDVIEFEDLVNELAEVFLTVRDKYDENRGKFSTFFVTCAYHHLNDMAEKQIDDVYKLGQVSMDTEIDGLPISELVVDEKMTPDQISDRNKILLESVRGLEPKARKVFSLLVKPTSDLKKKFRSVQVQKQFERDRGERVNVPQQMSISFIGEHLGMDIDNNFYKMRKEILALTSEFQV